MTGSRLAGELGRTAIVDTLAATADKVRRLNFEIRGAGFSFASWVDNLYFCGRTGRAALEAFELVEDHLQRTWALELKPESKKAPPAECLPGRRP